MPLLFKKINNSYTTKKYFIINIITIFLFIIKTQYKNTNIYHQIYKKKKTYYNKNYTHFLFNIKTNTYKIQYNNNIKSYFNHYNNIIKLKHIISKHTNKNTTKNKQKNIKTISSNLINININKLSSKKIKPPSSIIPLKTTNTNTNLIIKTNKSSSYIQNYISKKINYKLQYFINLTKNININNNYNSIYKKNKNIYLKTYSPLHYTIQKKPKNIITTSPNQITNLKITIQNSSLNNPNTNISILHKILIKLPTKNTQIIKN